VKVYDINCERSKWAADKIKMQDNGFAFPNLPWMTDDNVHLTQSLAILKYIARKHSLIALTPDEDMIEQTIVDVRWMWVNFIYKRRNESESDFLTVFHSALSNLDYFLRDRKWFGEQISYLDFLAWEFFDHVAIVFPEQIKALSNISEFYRHFAALPKLANYIKSDAFQKMQLYGPQARYAGSNVEIKRHETLYD